MCLLMIYGLNTWLPKLMDKADYPLGSSLMFLFVLNFGAIFGAIFGGWAADRWGSKKVLIAFYLLAAVSLTLLGFKANMVVLFVLVLSPVQLRSGHKLLPMLMFLNIIRFI